MTTLSMPRHATEEPKYPVVRELADVEVRQYAALCGARSRAPAAVCADEQTGRLDIHESFLLDRHLPYICHQ
jgi:ABC-type lipoprotein export system ATPase subunit